MNDRYRKKESHRTFSPVILFHDHSYVKDPSGPLEHIRIPYGDPYYRRLVEDRKEKIRDMLRYNGRLWSVIIQSTRLDLSCSSSTSSSPPQTPPQSFQHRQQQMQSLCQYSLDYDNTSLCLTTGRTDHEAEEEEEDMEEEEHRTSKRTEDWFRQARQQTSQQPPHEQQQHQPMSTSQRKPNFVMGRKRRGNLPKSVTAILKHWLIDHHMHPYPTEEEKRALRLQTNLTLNQISNWFINARRRLLPLILVKIQNENGSPSIPPSTTRKRSMTRKRTCSEAVVGCRRSTAPHVSLKNKKC
ncbi:hypothetical protein EC973_001648 [Apophysomyces ossiformis]|uniref:Homeobox domain-containing protein n=1 Tax=Apophysomyces ossiformis TaxID=679940 RepID=A0A8H7C081_9FUNG|nr:hypothetical protein EC973_001648 [Apophysomyces ossiformis]